MGWQNLLDYMFSSLFTQNKGYFFIFIHPKMAVPQNVKTFIKRQEILVILPLQEFQEETFSGRLVSPVEQNNLNDEKTLPVSFQTKFINHL